MLEGASMWSAATRTIPVTATRVNPGNNFDFFISGIFKIRLTDTYGILPPGFGFKC
jgi:hypothetical protein